MTKQFYSPLSSRRTYSQGKHCMNAEPGDIILVHRKGFLSSAIRLGQRLYYWRKRLLGHSEYAKEYCTWNHACVVVEGGPNAVVVEMAARGGVRTDLATYNAERYVHIVCHATAEQKKAATDFAFYCVFIKYGFLTIVGITLGVVIPWNITLGTSSLICSAATSLSARCMGLIPDGNDNSVMPADIARYFSVSNPHNG